MNNRAFIKAALKDHRVGALTISSKYVVQRLVRELSSHGYRYIVEYGAGDGVLTRALLELLPEDGRLIAIEINPQLLRELRQINDPRLEVIEGDVVRLSQTLYELNLPQVDAVVSGIPFSFLKPPQRRSVVRDTVASIAEGGMFLVYQYSPLILPHLKRYATNVRMSLEPRNFLPYFIMKAEK